MDDMSMAGVMIGVGQTHRTRVDISLYPVAQDNLGKKR